MLLSFPESCIKESCLTLLQFNNSSISVGRWASARRRATTWRRACSRWRTATAWCAATPRIYSRATRSRRSGSLLVKHLTLVMGNLGICIINEGGVILFAINEGKGIYQLHQCTIGIITCCASCLQCTNSYAIFSLVRCNVSVLTRSLASLMFVTNAVKPNL